jgi:putative ABC transport system permease protein
VTIALRELVRRPGRFLSAGGALMLIVVLILLLGGLLDGLYLGGTRALEVQSADVFVYSQDANDSFFRSRVDAETAARIGQVEGAGSVEGLSVVQLSVALPGLAEPTDAAVFAYEASNRRVPEPPPSGQAWFDAAFEDDGLAQGETVGFGPRRTPVKVAGFVEGTTFQLQGGVWMDERTWSRVVKANVPAAVLAPGTFQASLVTAAEDVDPAALTIAIDEQVPGVQSFTKQDAILGLPGVADQRSIFTAIIGVTFAVAGLVVALFFALLTLERVGLFGMLKAIGASSRTLAAGLSLQAVLIAFGAFALGALATLGLAQAIPDAIPVDLEIRRAVTTAIGLIITALIGSAVSFRRVIRIDPATAVGGS